MKRLYRSRTHRQIAGVCGGIAEYFGLDPVLVRVIFILMFFAGGSALLAYILAIILIPLEPLATPAAEGASPRPAEGGNAALDMVPAAAAVPTADNTAAGAGVLIGGI
ncbi:MAG TPA: PspC domain-containing protein, partial [Candidatus Aminicenantes bacterium]|nr:PspC domain-containing protein [Candidatus Aminicenantes bacterium]